MAREVKVRGVGEVIRFIRWFKKRSQRRLSRRTGIDQSQLSRYERDVEEPRPAQLERIAREERVPLRVWGFIRHCLQLIRKAITSETAIPAPPSEPADWSAETRAAVWRAVDRALALARAELAFLRSAPPPSQPSPPTAEDIAQADARVETLRSSTEAKRRLLIEAAPSFRDWVVCLRLCAASERAAIDDPVDALALAELALFIAARTPGTDMWRSRLEGWCTGFIAHARKVSGDLQLAEEIFARAWRLWHTGADEAGLLSAATLFDLQASLQRSKRKISEAITLHNKALAIARPEEIGYIFLNKSITLGERGDNESAIQVLEQAAREIDSKRQPRLFCVLRFNLAANLLRLHRVEEAAPIVHEVRKLVDRLPKNDLDRIRTRWLEGNLCAGQGRREEAVAALEEVRCAFRSLPFDQALASLDLALVYRAGGRWAEVQELAADLVKTFTALDVHREAIAALVLFQEAALQGSVTEELVRRLQDFITKARTNPKLRFAG